MGSGLLLIVRDGLTVLLTITAPIRLPSKTTDSLEDKIRILLERRSPGSSPLEAYRYIYSQLPAATRFQNVLTAFTDGSIGILDEPRRLYY
jgi:hypothetical protein